MATKKNKSKTSENSQKYLIWKANRKLYITQQVTKLLWTRKRPLDYWLYFNAYRKPRLPPVHKYSSLRPTAQHMEQCFFVNEDDDGNFRWRSYFNFRWRDENCDDNSDSFVDVTKMATKIGVFSSTRRWRRRKLSDCESWKLFRHKFEICKRLSRPYSVSNE